MMTASAGQKVFELEELIDHVHDKTQENDPRSGDQSLAQAAAALLRSATIVHR